jgi:predicted Zn-dependent protease
MDRKKLEAMLERGPDTALLRLSLGKLCAQQGQDTDAIAHLARAVELDPGYSAAWKLYARCLAAAGRTADAAAAYRSGITAAEKNGDMQALREMKVFLKRLEK